MARTQMRLTGAEKLFMDDFKTLCGTRSAWQVWADFVTLAACTLSNTVDAKHYDAREAEYMGIVGRYQRDEINLFPRLFGAVMMALEAEPGEDFLGALYMKLELGNHWKGQFFTPMPVCRMMADIAAPIAPAVAERGYIEINDPCCGAGATLIAAVEKAKREGVNFHDHVLFVGQDVDAVVAKMCYIQLSLLGCAGYIIIGNTLGQESPKEHEDAGNIWYMPFYFSKVWHWRRVFHWLDRQTRTEMPPPAEGPHDLPAGAPHYYYYYHTKEA